MYNFYSILAIHNKMLMTISFGQSIMNLKQNCKKKMLSYSILKRFMQKLHFKQVHLGYLSSPSCVYCSMYTSD